MLLLLPILAYAQGSVIGLFDTFIPHSLTKVPFPDFNQTELAPLRKNTLTAEQDDDSSHFIPWFYLFNFHQQGEGFPEDLLHQRKLDSPDYYEKYISIPLSEGDSSDFLELDSAGVTVHSRNSDMAETHFTLLISLEGQTLFIQFTKTENGWVGIHDETGWDSDPLFYWFIKHFKLALLREDLSLTYMQDDGQTGRLTNEALRKLYFKWLSNLWERFLERILDIVVHPQPVSSNLTLSYGGGEQGSKKDKPPKARKKPVERGAPKPKKDQAEAITPPPKRRRTISFSERTETRWEGPRREETASAPQKRYNFSKAELRKEKDKILENSTDTYILKTDITGFAHRLPAAFNQVITNALIHLGNLMSEISGHGKLSPPSNGEELALRIREKYRLEAQYISRIIRFIQYMNDQDEFGRNKAAASRYKHGLGYLLQYIILEYGGWLISIELLDDWLSFEDNQWSVLNSNPFPIPSEWHLMLLPDDYHANPPGFRPEGLPIGPAVDQELVRYSNTMEQRKANPDTDPFHFFPEREMSLYFIMTLLLNLEDLKQPALQWLLFIDQSYVTRTGLFEYILQSSHSFFTSTIPHIGLTVKKAVRRTSLSSRSEHDSETE